MINSVLHRFEKAKQALKNRGIKGFTIHATRRFASRYEVMLWGPDVIRLCPVDCLCNYRCPMCWIQHLSEEDRMRQQNSEQRDSMSLQEYERFFKSIPFGLREINVVGGGEPLLYKGIADLLGLVKRNGWRGSLITNGGLLTESLAIQMLKMRWDAMRVSVNAGDQVTFRKINGVDRYDQLVENLTRFSTLRHQMHLEKQVQMNIFHVIQKDNIHSIDKLFKIAETVKADSIEFDLVIPFSPEFALSAEQLSHAGSELQKQAALSPVPCNIHEIVSQISAQLINENEGKPFIPARSCSVGFDQSFITGSGNVLPCCFSDEVMGNVREQSFRTIWHGEKYNSFRKRLIRGQFASYCIKHRCSLPGVLHH